jgi:hypothetical protein
VERSAPLFLQGCLPSKSKVEWQEYRTMLFATVPKHIAAFLYHEARSRRYEQLIEFHWEDQFSPAEVEWINQQFQELTVDLECCDNFRAAKNQKSKQVRRYWKRAEEGCCGSMNVVRSWLGTEYLLGCNYGH